MNIPDNKYPWENSTICIQLLHYEDTAYEYE